LKTDAILTMTSQKFDTAGLSVNTPTGMCKK